MAANTESLVGDAQFINIKLNKLQTGCWIALIAIAAARVWFCRYEMTPDSMSYLDIGRAIADGHFTAAINSYWSPGYPALISPFFRVLHPNAYWEFPLIHAINLLVFAAAIAAFHIFWREALQWHRTLINYRDGEIPEGAFWAIGYAIFGIAALNVITVGLVGPDLLVGAFGLLAGWCAMRFRRIPGVSPALLLGFVLALGYYAKAPFFPLVFIFILCACWHWPLSKRMVQLTGLATVVFLALCAPLITALSLKNSRFTFGDSARLNEAFYIDGVQYFRHWQGGPPGAGAPLHATRKLNDFPQVYEFTADDMGTYPPWFAPAYWNAGIRPHFILKRQTIVLIRNLALEFQIVVGSGAAPICAVIILALLTGVRRYWIKQFLRLWFVWVPGAIAFLMFAFIHVEPRFLGGWLVMLFAGAICACRVPSDTKMCYTIQCVAAAVLVVAGAAVILQMGREAIGIDHSEGRSAEDASIATWLMQNGLHTGDHVAIIGDGTGAYWAHLARLRIIAEIPAGSASRPGLPARDFWESGTELQQKALDNLAGTGAKAVIAGANASILDAPPSRISSQWTRVGQTRAYVYFFEK